MRVFKISTDSSVFCDIEYDGRIIGVGATHPKLTIDVTVGNTIQVDISSPFSAVIVNKFRLAQGEPKTKFWSEDNRDEYNSLICESDSEPSQSDGPLAPTVKGRTEDLLGILGGIMKGEDEYKDSLLVVGAIDDVQFLDRHFREDEYTRFCRHGKVLAVRDAYVLLSGGTKGCYNKMRTPIGESVMKALKEFVCSRFIICDGSKVTRITEEDLVIGSHDCAIDAIYHMFNYVNALLLGKLAIVGASSV